MAGYLVGNLVDMTVVKRGTLSAVDLVDYLVELTVV